MELLNKGAGAFDPADLSYLAHKAGELLERVD
jgi:hypothetical protein